MRIVRTYAATAGTGANGGAIVTANGAISRRAYSQYFIQSERGCRGRIRIKRHAARIARNGCSAGAGTSCPTAKCASGVCRRFYRAGRSIVICACGSETAAVSECPGTGSAGIYRKGFCINSRVERKRTGSNNRTCRVIIAAPRSRRASAADAVAIRPPGCNQCITGICRHRESCSSAGHIESACPACC